MKTVPSDLVNCGTLVVGVRIRRKDGTVLGWTQHTFDQTVNVRGEDTPLLGNPGFTIQSIVSSAGLDVNNTEINFSTVGDDLNRPDVLKRKWDGAEVYFFRYNWKSPSSGIIAMPRGSFGSFKPQLGQFTVEFRDLRQAIQQNSTWLFQEACRWRLYDARCTVDPTAFTFTPISVTAATSSAYTFTASALTQASDYFGEGEVLWLTGENAGVSSKVRSFAAGVVTVSEALIGPIQVDDTFTIKAGCRKRWDEDCKTKFDNLGNFGGEKDKSTRDELIAPGVPG